MTLSGAYWLDGQLSHVVAVVRQQRGVLGIPPDANRFEFVLMDGVGKIYDIYRQRNFVSGDRDNREASIPRTADAIRSACNSGEGQHVEFKPLVNPHEPLTKPGSNQETKLREVITTAIAFANAGGGRIYLGVDRHCLPVGVVGEIAKEWGKALSNEEGINGYEGVLRECIKDAVMGEIVLASWHAYVDAKLVVVIEVSESPDKPVELKQDGCAYQRVGSSSPRISPRQWSDRMKVRGGSAQAAVAF